jgi:protein-S-isoprenylcysteine O-methyltransferase Ste14
MSEKPATAGVIAPPPLMLLAALLAGLGLDQIAPLGLVAQLPVWARYVASALLFLMGAWLLISASGLFGRANTPRAPWLPTKALVTDGLYAHTRNPMYVGFFCVLAALAFAFASDWCFVTLVVFALVNHVGVVMREERYLEGLFGEEYRAYKARVPRYGWRF